MKKNLTITLAALAAVALVFAGANGYACGSKCSKTAKTAANVEKCDPANCNHAATDASCAAKCAAQAGAQKAANEIAPAAAGGIVTADMNSMTATAASGCSSVKSASQSSCATSCASSKSAKSAKSAAADSKAEAKDWAAACGSKGYYAANVYEVRDGRPFAVCNGKTFEVTTGTPYTQIGEARYYFADEASHVSCKVKMAEMAARIDAEAVELATAEGNVRNADNGLKFAQCLESGKEFAVNANTPVKVMDGKKYYFASMSPEQASR